MANMPQLRKEEWANGFSGVKLFPNSASTDVTTEVLWAYYNQNGLYQDLMSQAFYLSEWHESMKPLRNPCNRSVEFFVSKLLPGVLPDALPILSENDELIVAIQDIMRWSNLNAKKSGVVRGFAVTGDIFIHPVANADGSEVYLQFIPVSQVTGWKENDRDEVVEIRIDVPLANHKMHTEYWTSDAYAIWEHVFTANTPLSDLTGLIDAGNIDELGIEFCPFVHAKFRDVGEHYGIGAFTHVLDKVDEVNRVATRLHQMLFRFNKPLFVLSANSVDAEGMPMPPPLISTETKDVADDDVWRLPGVSKLDLLIPDLKYADALAILQDMLLEVEKDLPELALLRLRDKGEMSGRAVRLFLADAQSRAEEARSNLEQGLIKAFEMGVQMGNALGIFTISGELDHQFQSRPIFEISMSEKSAVLRDLSTVGITGLDALRIAGFADDELPEGLLEAEKDPEIGSIEEIQQDIESIDESVPQNGTF